MASSPKTRQPMCTVCGFDLDLCSCGFDRSDNEPEGTIVTDAGRDCIDCGQTSCATDCPTVILDDTDLYADCCEGCGQRDILCSCFGPVSDTVLAMVAAAHEADQLIDLRTVSIL